MTSPVRSLLAPALILLASAANLADTPVTAAASRSFPGGSDQRAIAIVERAMAAHGGRERWREKGSVTLQTTWTHFVAGRPSMSSRYTILFPTGAGPLRMRVEAEENGKPVVMGVSGLRSWFMVGQERSEDLDVLKANRAFIRKVYGMLALPFRLDDPAYTLIYGGYEVRSGAPVDRVRVEHGLEPPMILLFDRRSGRLAGMGSPVTNPPTATLGDYLGFTEVEGILLPQVQVIDRLDAATGDRARSLMVSVDDVTFGESFAAGAFDPPAMP